MADATCSVDGCEKAAAKRGWCTKHYHRWYRHGDPLAAMRQVTQGSLEERFWAKVDRGGPIDCWAWTASTFADRQGYGKFQRGSGRAEAKADYAHRVSWELHFGPILDGMFVLHRCDNPPCVNPAHLFLGSSADNMRDMATKGRHGFASIDAAQARRIKGLIALGWSQGRIATEVGVPTHIVKNIRRGGSWRHA